MKKQQSITSLPPSPDEERHSRETRYLVTMAIRMACVILIFIVPGWWRLAAAIGAIVLPYIAVVLANVATRGSGATVIRPGSIVPVAISAESTRIPPEPAETDVP